MNAQEKKRLEELAYCATMQAWINDRLEWAIKLPTGGITTLDGDQPPVPKNPPPPPVNS